MTRLISLSMDQKLPLITRIRMRLHYGICVWCERYAQQIAFLRTAARRFPERFAASDAEGISAERKKLLQTQLVNHL
jgi:hypothetical protein